MKPQMFIRMKRLTGFLFFLVILVSGTMESFALPSFPGAEGFGAISAGGRGGRVIKVTNLNSSGPGSLQAACEAKGPRIVIFNIGGVIRGDIIIKNSYITIAGQTAPSPGITIQGRLLSPLGPRSRLHDIVVRFVRLRSPPTTGDQGDSIQLPNTERVILDHLSLSWANDETIDICQSSEVTVQWCSIEESDPTGHEKGIPHNFGLISTYPGSGNISIHHNLFAHHSRRSPSLAPYESGKPGDFRNNIVYNFHEGLTHDGHMPRAPINLIGNYYKRGPSSSKLFPFIFHKAGQYYLEGNFIEGFGVVDNPRDKKDKLPLWVEINMDGIQRAQQVPVAPIKTDTAQEAYRMVLAKAGCFPRDRVTQRTMEEVESGTGKWARNAPANPSDEWSLKDLPRKKPPRDTDGDGIPDDWEITRGLNKNDPRDYNKRMPSGYTAIEEYISERAEALLQKTVKGAVP
jgi:pectate lyase